VEASVGDVPQLSEITPEIKRLRRWFLMEIKHD
jgi:hypothetical protein